MKTRELVWDPVTKKLYPSLLSIAVRFNLILMEIKGSNMMLSLFLSAGKFGLLPLPDRDLNPNINVSFMMASDLKMNVTTKHGCTFSNPLGIASGID